MTFVTVGAIMKMVNWGLDDKIHRSTPQRVTALKDKEIIAIAAAGEHTLALTKTGKVYSWGYDGSWPVTTPRLSTALDKVKITAIIAGYHSSFALTEREKHTSGAIILITSSI